MGKRIPFDILICPVCKTDNLKHNDNEIQCLECGKIFRINNNKYYFEQYPKEKIADPLDKLKFILKKYDKFYSFLIKSISPVYSPNSVHKLLNNFIRPMSKNAVILNLGSGNSNISNLVSNIDIFPYKNVDLVCDISNLPFKPNSVDVVINIAVLEHLPNPQNVIKEIYRILKPANATGSDNRGGGGGTLYIYSIYTRFSFISS